MVAELGLQTEWVARWCGGCPCHDDFLFLRRRWILQGSDPSRGKNIEVPEDVKHCNRKGCRAAELASGLAAERMSDIFRIGGKLISNHTSPIKDPMLKAELQRNWEHVQGLALAQLTVKLSYWQSLPWIITGLSSLDVVSVRNVARKALALFDSNASGSDHLQSRRFLDPGFCGLRGDETPWRPYASLLAQCFSSRKVFFNSCLCCIFAVLCSSVETSSTVNFCL